MLWMNANLCIGNLKPNQTGSLVSSVFQMAQLSLRCLHFLLQQETQLLSAVSTWKTILPLPHQHLRPCSTKMMFSLARSQQGRESWGVCPSWMQASTAVSTQRKGSHLWAGWLLEVKHETQMKSIACFQSNPGDGCLLQRWACVHQSPSCGHHVSAKTGLHCTACGSLQYHIHTLCLCALQVDQR